MKLSLFFLAGALAFPAVQKRDTDTTTLTDDVWTTTVSSSATTITPKAFDGVTISASPVDDATTAWVSLDSSGIPYAVTPTVKDGSTTSASPTPTNTNYPTPVAAPPVLRCMNERTTYTDPICIANDTEFVKGETYWITWNPLYWNPTITSTDVSKVKVKVYPYPNDDDSGSLVTSDWIDNDLGYFAWDVTSDAYNSDNSGKVRIYLTPFIESDTDSHVMTSYAGPIVTVLKSKSDASSTISRVPSDNSDSSSSSSSTSSSTSTSSSKLSKSSSKAKIIAPAVVVPIVGIALIAGAVFFFLWRKRAGKMQKTSSPSIKMSRFSKGSLGSKSQRMSKASATDSVSYEEGDSKEQQ